MRLRTLGRIRRGLVTAAAVLGALGAGALGAPSASGDPRRTSAEVVVAATRGAGARASEVRFVTVDAGGATRTRIVATIPHAAEGVVRGDVLPGARAAVVAADVDGAPDRDWGAALWLVDEGGARRIATGLYHASRPLASSDGYVYVERGASGPWPSAEAARRGELRTDALAIDAIDPATGGSRRVATWTGYTMHLAGEWGAELVVYRVAFERADLVAIERATGRVRLLADVLPFARDFTVDTASGALVFSERDERDSHLWVVDRIDLGSRARTRLASERDRTPAAVGPAGGASGDGAWVMQRSGTRLVAVHAGSAQASIGEGGEWVEPLGFLGGGSGGAR